MMKIDSRNRQDILDKLKERALSYTPEWKFDTVQPDAASVIGLIFSHQMMENIKKLNQVWTKYHIAFSNLYGLSRKAAVPAKTICTLKVSEGIQGGVRLPRGTQVIGTTEDGEEVVFAFSQDIYAVNTELTDIIETSDKFLMFPQMRRPFRRQAVIMSFRSFPNLQEQNAMLRFRGNFMDSHMAELFADQSHFMFSAARCNVDTDLDWQHDSGLTQAFEWTNSQDGWLEISSSKALPTVLVDGEERTVLVLEMKKPPAEQNEYRNIYINGIELFAALKSVRPDFIWNGREEVNGAQFRPFTEQPALYDECLIGQDFLFERQGAVVTMHFRLEFGRHHAHKAVSVSPQLRMVRRKPQKKEMDLHYECRIEEVSLAYFNGKGWRRLLTSMDMTALFSKEENAGEYQITFAVPGDWERVVQGGYEGKCIRMQIVRADNCYLQEVEYIYPILSDVILCMEEQTGGIMPDSVAVVQGTKMENVQDKIRDGSGFCAFTQTQYQGNFVYWGFDRSFGQGPVSLFVELEKPAASPGLKLSYAYSYKKGFKPLKIIDQTNAFQNSGILLFAPPVDMAECEVDGIRRYWVRLQISDDCSNMPVVKKIHMNAVAAENSILKEEQDYYIDAIAPNMRFPLYSENIVSVQVWVNEKEQLMEDERNQLMREAQADGAVKIRTEYNFLGEVEDFYVLWHEVDSFENAAPMERCYCVDRGSNELLFGDGVHVRVPQSTNSIAFKTRVLCCDGEKANIRAGSIDRFRSTMISVEQIENPIDAYGGTNLERIQDTLERGNGILASHKRMVTEQDYIREAMAYSDMVAQAACVTGEDGVIRLVLLMRDYQKGDYSFRRIQEPLREHIFDKCEATCERASIQVEPPVFVKISVEIWIWVPELSKSIDIRQQWMERILSFLEPVKDQGENRWRIGRLPETKQIRLMLNTLESTARLVYMNVMAQYSCEQCTYEAELDEIVVSPFMVCCNGTHHIYIVGDEDAQ